jgi:hypothetical protein
MKRIVQLVGRNGLPYDVALTAEQADFFLRLAEYKAQCDPTMTFRDVVVEWQERQGEHGHDAAARKN